MKFAKKITQIILLVFIFDINIKMQLVNQIGANIELSQFDDNYIFKGPITEIASQIGNAVPPVLAWHIAKSIKDMMNNTTFEINTLNEKLSA